MEKKVVFVSVPMKGKDDALIERSIQLAKVQYCHIKKVNAENVIFVDGFHNVYQKYSDTEKELIAMEKNEAIYWLGNSIALMCQVDEVIFAQGWEHARGCNIEEQVANNYGIPMIKMTKVKSAEILAEMRAQNKKKVKKLWKDDKLSIKEIAKRTKFPESTICKWCEEIDKE